MSKDPADQPGNPPGDGQKAALAELRAGIDATDDELLRLLNQRAELVRKVADLKTAASVPFYVPSRERQITERLAAANPGPFPTESIRSVFQEIMSACLTLEKRVRVAFLGPEGTFSDMAVKRQFGLSARTMPMGTIPSVFEEVERGNADYGVVPVENTTEGMVTHTLDTFLESDLKVCAEIALEVNMCLLARHDVAFTRDRAGLLDPHRAGAGAALAGRQPPQRDAGRVALDRRGRATGARRRPRRRHRLGAGRQDPRAGRAAAEDRRHGPQHDALPGAGARSGRADRAGQDLAAAGDPRRVGNPLPRAGRLRSSAG